MNLAIADNPRAVIGGNCPPTPYEAIKDKIDELYDECKLWLDGAEVDNSEMADGIGNLLGMLRNVVAESRKAHKIEKQPWLDGAKEVQDRYNALWEKTERASNALNAALAPWLAQLQAEQDAIAKAARDAAEAVQREAEQAIRTAAHDDLAAREAAETKIAEAKAADRAATRAEKAKPQAGGAFGRRIGLKPVYSPVLIDGVVAARHYWTTDRAAMEAFLLTLARKDVRAGKREIPGFEIKKEKQIV